MPTRRLGRKPSSLPSRLRYPENKAEAASAPLTPNEDTRNITRPNKLDNPETRGLLLGAAAFTSVEIAASMAGVDPASVYKLRKRDPEFEEKWQSARARTTATVELSLVNNAVKRMNVDAQKFYLTHNKPEIYKPKSELEVRAPIETIEIVKAAAKFMRDQRRLGIPIAEVVEEFADGNGRDDAVAIVKMTGGNGNGSGGDT